jgi:putative (di)nucleoside polyphosphate hydrolase
MSEDLKEYRANVGIVVINNEGKVLVGERVNYPGVFQYPQGGIDKDEDPLSAARRELFEEIGLKLNDTLPIDEISDWLIYDFPHDIPKRLKKYKGQKQKWFFFRWDGNLNELSLDHHEKEFSLLKWADAADITENIVDFKRATYRIIEKRLESVISNSRSSG